MMDRTMLFCDEVLKELEVVSLKRRSKRKLKMTISRWGNDCKRKEGGCLFCTIRNTGLRTMGTSYKEQILHRCNDQQ